MKLGLNALALALIVAATVLGVVGLVKELAVVDIIALTAPLIGLAGTIVNREGTEAPSDQNDSAQGH